VQVATVVSQANAAEHETHHDFPANDALFTWLFLMQVADAAEADCGGNDDRTNAILGASYFA